MKRPVLLYALLFLFSGRALANEQVRDVQSELKGLGFYYGEINGQTTAETTAAIRRYQIRNGLEVTGTLTAETLAALGKGPAPVTPQAPAAKRSNPPAPPPTVEEKDRKFLQREEAAPTTPAAPLSPAPRDLRADPSVVPPPAPLEHPSADFPVLFEDTPYAIAPPEVQEATLRRAQSLLASRGFYREVIDGLPGPATEEALLTYQQISRLPLTGRLDMQTLSALRLLPTRSVPVPRRLPPERRDVYRGIWIR
ncbi:MAG: Peptidoglycan-binding domain 1 protein [Chthoniobacter sp.]|nr:Peptidoglycan-binding domain 1 protein [Chthoniobacter sp.]